jgi:hypothetical protein
MAIVAATATSAHDDSIDGGNSGDPVLFWQEKNWVNFADCMV